MIKELFPYKTTLPRNSRPHVYNTLPCMTHDTKLGIFPSVLVIHQ